MGNRPDRQGIDATAREGAAAFPAAAAHGGGSRLMSLA
jgi:hypothetical protein